MHLAAQTGSTDSSPPDEVSGEQRDGLISVRPQGIVPGQQTGGIASVQAARRAGISPPMAKTPSPASTAGETRIPSLSPDDSRFLVYLRGIAILAIVVGHLGGWILPPYTEFVAVFVPVFFFLSGAVSYYSYQRSSTIPKYLVKRIGGILVPYWMLCVFWLAVYLAVNSTLPEFSVPGLFRWLFFRPDGSAALFGIGQVWFLHTLVIILLASPVLFELYQRHPRWLMALMVVPLALAATQTFRDVHADFYVLGNNFYKPVVHGLFFVGGFVYFTSPTARRKPVLAGLGAAALLMSVCLVTLFDQDVNCSPHTFSPDLYYVAVSVCAIVGVLLFQTWFLRLCDVIAPARVTLRFLHKYTFPIFLLHGFAIYVSEEVFGLVHPDGGHLVYAVTKCAIVILVTCVLAVPFGSASTWLVNMLVRRWSQTATVETSVVVDETH